MKLNTHIYKKAVTALCILSLSPALVFAADGPKPIEERGIIKSVDLDTHTLVVTGHKNNSEQKFQWTDQTKFSTRRKNTSASALKEGERVHLTYTPGGDSPVLQAVRITPARTEKHSANDLSPARSNRA
jgi:Cu/Ag efflux protein CusF